MATGGQRCEFFLVRYVSDTVRNEFVNIGVLLRAAGGGGGETLVRFTRNWSRLRCADPDAEIATIEAVEADLRRKLSAPELDEKPILGLLEDSLSNNLQLTGAQVCDTENIAAHMDVLMRLYVEPRKREPVSRRSGRQAIYATMRTHFERGGVWPFMDTQIRVSRYLDPADTLRIDCGYRNGKARMFQAISLEELDTAKILAYCAPRLSQAVLAQDKRELELTAIAEPLVRIGGEGKLAKSDDQIARYEFGRRILEEAEIRFMTTSDLPRIVETARRELGI